MDTEIPSISKFGLEWFQPQMKKIKQLPVKGAQFAVHVLWSKIRF